MRKMLLILIAIWLGATLAAFVSHRLILAIDDALFISGIFIVAYSIRKIIKLSK